MMLETDLHNSVVVIAHCQFRDVTHQIVEPVVDASENVDWLAHITAVVTYRNTCTLQSSLQILTRLCGTSYHEM